MAVLSLGMSFARVGDVIEVCADWLDEPVYGATFYEAYWRAVELRARP